MKNIGNTVFLVAVIMLATKVLTMFSNILYLAKFGINDTINIYSFALQMPNIIFNCIGTALNTVVIPIYLSLKSKGNDTGSKKFIDDIITIASVLIFILIGIGMLLAPFIAGIGGYSSLQEPETYNYAVFAIRILLPIMFFHGINYIFQGFLQANDSFKLPALVSAPSAIVIILYVIFFSDIYGVTGLLYATLIGFSFQPLILLPMVRKLGYRYSFSFDIKSKAIMQAGRYTVPVLLSVSSYQINMFFNTTMALRFGTNSIMTYVQQIAIVSILTVVYAVVNVYFPKLTRLWADNDKSGYRKNLSEIVLSVAFLLIPAAFGFWILRAELADFLANWGKIDDVYVNIAGNMLALYGFGVLAIGLKEIMDKAFYAQEDTKTPAVFGFVIMICNVAISLLLLDRLGTYSMPFSYSVSSFIGLSGLAVIMHRRIGFIDKSMVINILKCFGSAVIMAGSVFIISNAISEIYIGGVLLTRLIKIVVPVSFGVLVYFTAAVILKIPQGTQIIAVLAKKKK